MKTGNKEFPEGMVPLGDSEFFFDCHPGVECFTACCNKVNLTLYPFDIIQIKKFLKVHSEEFLRLYTTLVVEENPYFPNVKLLLTDEKCPFSENKGCKIYESRPSACRTYPLERAVDRTVKSARNDFYFMTNHDYCKGHKEATSNTVKSWIRNQNIHDYNLMNDLWAEIDTIFLTNPWKGEGVGGEKQQLAFMICYNIDGFRQFVIQHSLLNQYELSKHEKRGIEKQDSELLKFGFEWLRLILTGKGSLIRK